MDILWQWMLTELFYNDQFCISSAYANWNWNNYGFLFSFKPFFEFEQCVSLGAKQTRYRNLKEGTLWFGLQNLVILEHAKIKNSMSMLSFWNSKWKHQVLISIVQNMLGYSSAIVLLKAMIWVKVINIRLTIKDIVFIFDIKQCFFKTTLLPLRSKLGNF